jgi:hypothetical protein
MQSLVVRVAVVVEVLGEEDDREVHGLSTPHSVGDARRAQGVERVYPACGKLMVGDDGVAVPVRVEGHPVVEEGEAPGKDLERGVVHQDQKALDGDHVENIQSSDRATMVTGVSAPSSTTIPCERDAETKCWVRPPSGTGLTPATQQEHQC